MKLVIQRVTNASVEVEGEITGQIEEGLMVLVGFGQTDSEKEVEYLARKLCKLRIFPDDERRMNLSVMDIGGKLLLVPQFTLYGNCNDGNRPSFTEAAKPDEAIPLYEYFCNECEKNGIEVQKGIFGADMKVELLNDGPVTIIIEK